MIYVKYFKYLFDFVGAAVLLVCLSPLLLVLIATLYITQGRSIFYRQLRTGLHLAHFNLYKFKTLEDAFDDSLSLKERRYTRTGRFLRKSGLDELPQLLNILKGEMSFIGPRPLPVDYESRYSPDQLKRFNLKPGLTGWAQVHGRNETTWDKRFEMDLWYVRHVSVLIDLKIMLKTILMALKGIFGKSRQEVVMEVFKGSKLI